MYSPGPTQCVATLVQDLMPGAGHAVVGVSGTTYAQRLAGTATMAPASARSFPSFGNYQWPWLIDIGGQSDLIADMTAPAILANMVAYHDAAHAAGAAGTVVSTVPPAVASIYTAPREAARLALNDLIRASSAWEAVADLAAIPQDPATDTLDGLHPALPLATLFAEEIVAVLTAA